MIQKYIIYFLATFIFASMSIFGLKTIKELKESNKQLQTQIIALNEQNAKNMQDLENRNKEIINNGAKINDLQKKIRNQFKKDDCVNVVVNNDFLDIVQNSNN